MIKPELLAPAGDFEKLRAAVAYGADAIYLGAQSFSLRAKARNFDGPELLQAIEYAHEYGVKVYVTANIFAHNEDFRGLEDFFKMLYSYGADAVIISDPGFFEVCRDAAPGLDIHISTQANNTNYRSAGFWHKLGASRVVLARELSLAEIAEIREKSPVGLTLEAFVHGAMCISYSGRCLLSSYLTNRDANRGECSQPCRFSYRLEEATRPGEYLSLEEDTRGTYIFNSKDLCLAAHLPELISAGIGSFKIEGRMKTPYYVASVVKAYREAIDDLAKSESFYRENIPNYLSELEKTSHRNYSTGFYFGKTDENSQTYSDSSYIRGYDFAGIVLGYDSDTGFAVIEQRNKFSAGCEAEFLRSKEENFKQIISEILDENGSPVSDAPHPRQILRIKTHFPVKELDILRVKK